MGSGKIWALSLDEKTGLAAGVRLLYASSPDGPRFNPTMISPDAAGEPLFFSHSLAVIFTLRENHLLADADEPPLDEIAPGDVGEPVEEVLAGDAPS